MFETNHWYDIALVMWEFNQLDDFSLARDDCNQGVFPSQCTLCTVLENHTAAITKPKPLCIAHSQSFKSDETSKKNSWFASNKELQVSLFLLEWSASPL